MLSTTVKRNTAAKAAKTALKNPGALRSVAQVAAPAAKAGAKAGKPLVKAGKPLVKRRTRRRVEQFGQTARAVGETLVTYGPQAAYELGLVERPEPPKPKRTTPRVAAGIVIGASAMYFLEPEHGRERREKVAELVG